MDKVDYREIVSCGKTIRAAHPEISDEDLKKALELRFMGGMDLPMATHAGCIIGPHEIWLPWITAVKILYFSMSKVIVQDKAKLSCIQSKIDDAVIELKSTDGQL